MSTAFQRNASLLAHREPLAAVLIERERFDRGPLSSAFVGRLHNAEIFGAVPQNGDPPGAELSGCGFFFGIA